MNCSLRYPSASTSTSSGPAAVTDRGDESLVDEPVPGVTVTVAAAVLGYTTNSTFLEVAVVGGVDVDGAVLVVVSLDTGAAVRARVAAVVEVESLETAEAGRPGGDRRAAPNRARTPRAARHSAACRVPPFIAAE
jgi:hypothetical protein